MLVAPHSVGILGGMGPAAGADFVRLFVEVDAVGGGDFLAEHGGLAVDFHPALFDVAVGLAARA